MSDYLAPLRPLLEDPDVVEIMVNGTDSVYVDKRGQMIKTDVQFNSDQEIIDLMNALLEPLGRVIDESHPLADARLADGTRINMVIPPIALTGPVITMRKIFERRMTAEDLIRFGSLDRRILDFLVACIRGNLNVVMAGGTASGKTTVFNILSDFIPETERLVAVEKHADLQIRHEHLIRLEARPANLEGKGEITVSQLIDNAVKMRPDRLLVGELEGEEVLPVLQAMGSGYDGSMFTIHANSPREALERIEYLAVTSGTSTPVLNIRQMMASSIDVIIQQLRLRDGKRKIIAISEVLGMKNNVIDTQDIMEFQQTGVDGERIVGEFVWLRDPQFLDKIENHLPDGFFNS